MNLVDSLLKADVRKADEFNTDVFNSKRLANILNISLVLVFIPADDVEYLKLMTVYRLFDGIRILGYKYSPHVTLGYFNVNGFDVTSVTRLENLVNELNEESFEMVISTEDLFYQHFTSMNDYQNIFKFT